MTGELILFEGKQVRTREAAGETWLPLIDLAEAWGLDRTTLPKHIERNKDFFEGCSADVDILSHDESALERQQCVNEEGLYLLLARVSKGKVKNPAVKASITRFRKMVPKLIKQERVKQTVPAEPQQPSLKDEIARARMLAEETGGDPREFMKIALDKCGAGDYAPALNSSSIVHGEAGQWFNPTQLAARIGDPTINAERVNHYLHNKGYQLRDALNGFTWRLTPEGMNHGEEYWYTSTSKHGEWRIRWRESILYVSGLMKRPDSNQLSLPARAA